MPDALNIRLESLVSQHAVTLKLWMALPGGVPSITRRGNLQNLADRLDPVLLSMLVDKAL
jgi:hypothetical protein